MSLVEDDDAVEHRSPDGADDAFGDQKAFVDREDRRMRRSPVEEGELLAESKVLEHQLPAGPKSGTRREE
jgi:hypothetical protein